MDQTFLTAVLLAALVSGALAICAPNCSESSAGDRVEDPMDCHNFYVCLGPGVPSDAPISCPDFSNFFQNSSDCLPEECSPTCTTSCRLSCSLVGSSIIADPFNCNEYSVCLLGSVQATLSCPDDLPYFDGSTCVSDENLCCRPFCTPYCYPDAVEVPDPHDCKSFYICEDGTLNNNTHKTCPNDEVFDITAGRCREQAECVTFCGDSTTTTTPTTTTTTTTTTSTSSGCYESFTCPSSGSFARCGDTCSQTYFSCSGPDKEGEIESCNEGFLFNPNPEIPTCVASDLCPFYPRQ